MKADTIEFYVPDELIMNQTYYIREHKVMIDVDLAKLYHPKPGTLTN